MCWTTTQPNWLLVFFTQQKTKICDDGQALPNFFPPQQPKVSVFITSSLCSTTDKHLFQKPK